MYVCTEYYRVRTPSLVFPLPSRGCVKYNAVLEKYKVKKIPYPIGNILVTSGYVRMMCNSTEIQIHVKKYSKSQIPCRFWLFFRFFALQPPPSPSPCNIFMLWFVKICELCIRESKHENIGVLVQVIIRRIFRTLSKILSHENRKALSQFYHKRYFW